MALYHTPSPRPPHRIAPTVHAKSLQNMLGVIASGPILDDECLGNLSIRFPVCHQFQYLKLSRREFNRLICLCQDFG